MKLGVISDIHVDRNKAYPVIELLAEKSSEKELSCLLIAGDISNEQSMTLASIDRLRSLVGIPVYFVPGNHDLWSPADNSPTNTHEIYRRYEEHPSCLAGKNVALPGNWAVLGETGWYDYSFGSDKFSEEDFKKKTMFGRTWQDSVRIDWGQPDMQVHRDMLARLEKQLAETAGKNRIVLTHMLTSGSFTVPESREIWTYFNAFLGSGDYGALFEKYGIRYSIMGHVHFRRRLNKNGVTYVCACLNYESEWQSGDCGKEIEETLTVLDIEEP